jgi:hypothetical protein
LTSWQTFLLTHWGEIAASDFSKTLDQKIKPGDFENVL